MELRVGITPVHYCKGKGAEVINRRLESFERVDAGGHQSDQLTLVVYTGADPGLPAADGLPEEDAVLDWFEGYEERGPVRIGAFRITRITPRLFPPRVTIVATAAPFGTKDETGFKERRTRSWSKPTLGDLFRAIVKAHGLDARVDPELDPIPLGHIDQTSETDAAFLSRLAREHDAVAKPMDGMYLLALRGRTTTISGEPMDNVVLTVPPNNTPKNPHFINCETDNPSRKKVGGVIACWKDEATGKTHEERLGEAPYRKLPGVYVNREHALQSLKGQSRKAKREKKRLTLDIPGDPYLSAEMPLTLDKSFPHGMAGEMSIDRLVARGTRDGGYRMSIEATTPIKDEKKQ
ncbi:hypothetical protein LZT27_18550 [Aeromonas veronii]|uniref:contractile injection system protein, VgrG/Pvc8 family n=1 Tax=Aeromonas veronii TaxID=654 RepID=UPI0023636D8D|nr:contractile injection system protein, VgrG/Pvc8 family [Aeromonas veronii]MDD1846576.1 hypothetical protein [Aeromonas veronii]